MTDKELRHLKRAELLEILFYLQKENEALRAENESLRHSSENDVFNLSPDAMEQIKDTVRETIQEISGENHD